MTSARRHRHRHQHSRASQRGTRRGVPPAVGDVLTDDVFLDGNPPLWRFQLQGIEAFAAWYKSYAPNGMDEVTVVRTVPTASGFVTELTERNREDTGKEITGREIVLCTVRDGRISELTVYCSGDWDEELQAPRGRSADAAPVTGHFRAT